MALDTDDSEERDDELLRLRCCCCCAYRCCECCGSDDREGSLGRLDFWAVGLSGGEASGREDWWR